MIASIIDAFIQSLIYLGSKMTFLPIYLLPLGAALISCCVAFTCRIWLFKSIKEYCSKQSFIDEILCSSNLEQCFKAQWHAQNFEKDIEQLVNKQMEELFSAFKVQVPMIGMFLSVEREEKLKEQARTELMKLVPALKQRFLEQFITGECFRETMKSMIADKAKVEFDRLISQLLTSMRYSYFSKAFILGFCLGALEAVLFIII